MQRVIGERLPWNEVESLLAGLEDRVRHVIEEKSLPNSWDKESVVHAVATGILAALLKLESEGVFWVQPFESVPEQIAPVEEFELASVNVQGAAQLPTGFLNTLADAFVSAYFESKAVEGKA